MLKNTLKKKFFLIFSALFIIFILYLFPAYDENKIKDNKNVKDQETIIYLLDNNNYVGRVAVISNEKDKIKKAKEMLSYLIINNAKTSYLKEGFKPLIPAKTKILSIQIDKDLIKINFSNDILKISEDNEEKMLSSIIYSMTSIEGIKKVSIYVEGNILNKLPNSKKQLNPVLDRTYGINQIYDFTKINGTTKTTIYYLAKYKDYFYYVPVTMISNQNEEKMEIIIEELSSKAVYETSLISYLKSSKEISYKISEENITLNLNKILFDNLNNDNLIESLIYTINLSIKDNYSIKKVIYNIDNNLYKTYSI
jgi:germination protein M